MAAIEEPEKELDKEVEEWIAKDSIDLSSLL